MLVVLLLLALIDFIQFVCASMCRLVGVRTVLMELLSSDGQCVLSQLTMHSDIHLGAINRRAPLNLCVVARIASDSGQSFQFLRPS